MKNLYSLIIIGVFLGSGSLQAQTAISASGGNSSGAGGTSSYTLGQTAYTVNSGTTGTVLQGCQQPYEIYVVTGLNEESGLEAGFEVYPNPSSDFVKQAEYAGVGLLLLIAFARIDYRVWGRFAVPLMGITVFLLVLLLFTTPINGARRWLLDGSLQPSEIAKFAVIIYMARWLSSKGDKLHNVTYGLLPFAIIVGTVAGLIVLEPNLSTAIIIAVTATCCVMCTRGPPPPEKMRAQLLRTSSGPSVTMTCTALMLGLPPPITMTFCAWAGGSSTVAP